jgi:hypothetical protein
VERVRFNDGISNDSVDKQSSGSKFSSFGPTSFSGVYNVKDYQTFNSTHFRYVPHEGVDPRP